jgi:ornithine cyclodeaminase/alanine dehydrogenase-like protein (mu-crystallin family)
MKWTRRHDGAPLLTKIKEKPKRMTTNPGNKVVSALQTLKSEIDAATDDIIADARKQSERTKDGFHKVKVHVLKPWYDANAELEDYVNQLTNGGPPLDE